MTVTLLKPAQKFSFFLQRWWHICCTAVAFWLLFCPALQADETLLPHDQLLSVADVLNGKSFTLQNGQTVRLAGLQAPNIEEKSGKMRPGEPLGEASHQALQRLLHGKQVTLAYGPQPRDRHGRLVAQVTLEDGRSVQQEMLQQGMALAYWFPDNRDWLQALLPYEAEAREAERGIWAHDYWRVRQAKGLRFTRERFLLVEGVPRSVKQVRGNWYLNFGEDWKTDFTAMVNKDSYRRYFNGMELTELEGRPLRLRGWVYRYNGPMLELIVPEQIEQLEP